MILAVSGKCCSGKNFVSEIFKRNGFEIIDVDKISHRVFNQKWQDISDVFGNASREEIGKIVFSNPEMLIKLEEIIHPPVYKEIFNMIDDQSLNYVINIPLLTNIELVKKLDAIIWITSPLYIRVKRALKRDNYTIKTVIKRIITQKKLSVKQFKNLVDIYSIRNGFISDRVVKSVNNLLKILK